MTEVGEIIKKRRPVVGETVPIKVTCKRADGTPLDLESATMWVTIKTDPDTQDDASAVIQIDSVNESSQFQTASPASNGIFTATLLHTDTDDLDAGTLYYIDIKVKDASGNMYYPAPNQTIIFDEWVTRSTSA